MCKWQYSIIVTCLRLYNVTMILHCNEKWKIIIAGATLSSQASLGYFRSQIGFVFAEYDLSQPTIFIQNYIYIKFGIILTEFYIISWHRTSDRTLMGLNQLLICLDFSLYPISFLLYSLFKTFLWSWVNGISIFLTLKYIWLLIEKQK